MTAKFTLQKKGLTNRYMFSLLDLLMGRPGLSSRLPSLVESLGEFDYLSLILLLQGLTLSSSVLELLLDFGHPLLILAAGGLLGLQIYNRFISCRSSNSCLLLGLLQGTLESLNLGRTTCKSFKQGSVLA